MLGLPRGVLAIRLRGNGDRDSLPIIGVGDTLGSCWDRGEGGGRPGLLGLSGRNSRGLFGDSSGVGTGLFGGSGGVARSKDL